MKYLSDEILPLVADNKISPRELALLELYNLQPTTTIVSMMEYFGWSRRIAKYTSYLLHRRGFVSKCNGQRQINHARISTKIKKGTRFVPPGFILLFSEYFSKENHVGLKNYLIFKCNLPPESAEDILQTTYLKAIERHSSFQPETNFNAWIFRIMKNTMIDYVNDAKKQTPTYDMDIYPDTTEHEEHPALSLDLLKMLPDELGHALNFSLHGLSVADISILMGVPEGTVKSRVHRAKKILKEKLQDRLATIQP